MPSITSTGVGSGLDVNAIVSSLMSVEKRPLTQLQVQASTLQTRISAFGALKSQLSSLGDVAGRLATATNWNPMKVESSSTTALTATVASGAAPGRHSLAVTRLAQAQVLSSAAQASSAAVLGTGTLTLEVGKTEGGVFTPRSGSTAVTVTITEANQTLAGVRDAINAAKAGVTASIVQGSEGARLVLRGADGAESSLRVTAADADGNSTDAAGLSALAYDPAAAAGAGRNLTQGQAAQDALLKIDGIDVTSASNTVTGALEGVTLQLRQVGSEPVTVDVTNDAGALRKNVNDFVNAYNALNKLVQAQTQVDASGANRGPLQADSTAVNLLNGLRTQLRGSVAGLQEPASLAAAGIELQRDGSLKVDDKKFAPLLENPQQLAGLFSQAGEGDARGFGVRFKAWAEALTGTAGPVAARTEGLQRSIDGNRKQQDAAQDRLARTEARLRAQYQRLDTQMSALNAQMKQMAASLGLG